MESHQNEPFLKSNFGILVRIKTISRHLIDIKIFRVIELSNIIFFRYNFAVKRNVYLIIMIYPLLKKLLFQLNPENAHHLGIFGIRTIFNTPIASSILSSKLRYESPSLKQTIMGIEFENPVGLAAGFDKHCDFFQHFHSLGFGFGEVGTITPIAQKGNDKPRLFRDKRNHAILNRMGFNNGGLDHCKKILSKMQNFKTPIAINIGKNKITPNEQANQDYQKLIEGLSDYASFFVVNISSPNTPGLRNLQAKGELKKLLEPIMETNSKLQNKPIALKIAPDITESEAQDIVDVVFEVGISCIVATNTTIDKSNISSHLKDEAGGVSGKPVQSKSDQVLKWIAQKVEKRIPIIGVGGIFNADDAYRKIKLGANLVEVYTGWIYEGPYLIKKINIGLEQALKRDGFKNISEAVGLQLKEDE